MNVYCFSTSNICIGNNRCFISEKWYYFSISPGLFGQEKRGAYMYWPFNVQWSVFACYCFLVPILVPVYTYCLLVPILVPVYTYCFLVSILVPVYTYCFLVLILVPVYTYCFLVPIFVPVYISGFLVPMLVPVYTYSNKMYLRTPTLPRYLFLRLYMYINNYFIFLLQFWHILRLTSVTNMYLQHPLPHLPHPQSWLLFNLFLGKQ